LLNVASGTLALKTGQLRQHDPADLITKLAPVKYDPDADQGEWLRFLERVIPDSATRAFLQGATGYSMTGLASEEVLFFVCGPTAGGKSTFVSAICGALGDYAATANFTSFLTQHDKGGPRPDIVRLAGKRFVSSVETEEGAQLAGGLLKWITGQDRLCERTLYKTEVEFLPTFSLWLVSNFRPRAQDNDSALWRRLMLLPFEVSIPENERDPSVKARLRDPTIGGPAVLAWAVAGCLDWQEHGLQPPPAVLAATRHWRAENDPIIDWLTERAILTPAAETPFKDLNACYRQWAVDVGIIKPISGKKLAERLQDHGCRKGSGSGHARTYAGIGLKC
jgi:putative DNA primase/helicase